MGPSCPRLPRASIFAFQPDQFLSHEHVPHGDLTKDRGEILRLRVFGQFAVLVRCSSIPFYFACCIFTHSPTLHLKRITHRQGWRPNWVIECEIGDDAAALWTRNPGTAKEAGRRETITRFRMRRARSLMPERCGSRPSLQQFELGGHSRRQFQASNFWPPGCSFAEPACAALCRPSVGWRAAHRWDNNTKICVIFHSREYIGSPGLACSFVSRPTPQLVRVGCRLAMTKSW
jgi:hypothetical protein